MTSTPLSSLPARTRRDISRSSELNDSSDARSPSILADTLDGQVNSPPVWSGAVGRATLSGKTGRVIEKLMADIDKLRRELKAEIALRQEVERREETRKAALDSLREENENLALSMNLDGSCLRRRDRKIDELRTELLIERQRREVAETKAREAVSAREKMEESSRKSISEAQEAARQAQRQCDILGQGHRQLATEYRGRSEAFERDFEALMEERNRERSKVERLDVVVEQMGHELELNRGINMKLGATLKIYKTETRKQVLALEEQARQATFSEATFRREAEKVVEEAKWLITITKRAAGDGDLNGQPR